MAFSCKRTSTNESGGHIGTTSRHTVPTNWPGRTASRALLMPVEDAPLVVHATGRRAPPVRGPNVQVGLRRLAQRTEVLPAEDEVGVVPAGDVGAGPIIWATLFAWVAALHLAAGNTGTANTGTTAT